MNVANLVVNVKWFYLHLYILQQIRTLEFSPLVIILPLYTYRGSSCDVFVG